MSQGSTLGHLTADPGSRRAWLVVAISAGTASVGGGLATLFGAGHFVYAFAAPLGILFGSAGVLGFALGSLFRELAAAQAGPVVLVRVTSDAVLVLVWAVMWQAWPLPGLDDWQGVFASGGVYLSTALAAAACSVAWFLVTGPLLTAFSFVPAVPVLFTARFVPQVVLGPLVLLGVAVAADGPYTPTSRRSDWLTGQAFVVLLSLLWLSGAFVLGLVHHDVASVPQAREQFAKMLPGVVEPLGFAAAGGSYPLVQAFLALLVGALLTVAVRK